MNEKIDLANRLSGLIKKLRKNRERVPETELKTKYAKSYEQLKKDIATVANRIILLELQENFLIFEKDTEVFDQLQAYVDKQKEENGYIRLIHHALIEHYDINRMVEYIRTMEEEIYDSFYFEYENDNTIIALTEEYGAIPYNKLRKEFLIDDEWVQRPVLEQQCGFIDKKAISFFANGKEL